MKILLIALSLFMLIGCGTPVDSRGFYTQGEKIGINKETKTKFDKKGFDFEGFDESGYDKEGYDRNGFDKDNYGRDGWSKTKFFNKETKDEYDINGYNYYGFDKEGINKDTGTKYNTEGFDKRNFNEKGIHKKTGFSFNSLGSPQQRIFFTNYIPTVAQEFLLKPYRVDTSGHYQSWIEDKYFSTKDDSFTGITYIGRSYNHDFFYFSLKASVVKASVSLAELTRKNSDYINANKSISELLQMIKGKFYIDIITNYSPDNKVSSYFTFTFFSPEKQNNANSVELLVDNKIFTIDKYSFNSENAEFKFSRLEVLPVDTLPLYFNQVKIL